MKINTRTVELTKAQIDGLNTGSPVPLDILAPPASGYAIVIHAAQFWKTAGGAATAGTSDIDLSYGAGTKSIGRFTNVDAAGGALGSSSQNLVQNMLIDGTNAVAASGQSVSISASAAIVCAASTKANISIDFEIKKLTI